MSNGSGWTRGEKLVGFEQVNSRTDYAVVFLFAVMIAYVHVSLLIDPQEEQIKRTSLIFISWILICLYFFKSSARFIKNFPVGSRFMYFPYYYILGLSWTSGLDFHRGAFIVFMFASSIMLSFIIFQLRLTRAFIIGAIICSLCLMASVYLPPIMGFSQDNQFGYLLSEQGVIITDPNELGTVFGLGAFMCLYNFTKPDSGYWGRIISYVGFTVLFFATGLTASRGSFVSLVLTIVSFFTLQTGISSGKKALVYGFLVFWTISSLAYLQFASGNSVGRTSLFERLGDETTVTLGDRTTIWETGFDAASNNTTAILFGYGTGSADRVLGFYPENKAGMLSDGTARASPHNVMLQILLDGGIVGLILYCIFLFYIIKKSLEHYRKTTDSFHFSVAIFYFLSSQTLVSVLYPFWIIFGSIFILPLFVDKSESAEVNHIRQ